MTVTVTCPTCSATHEVKLALERGPLGGAQIVLEHQQTALALEQTLRENEILTAENLALRARIAELEARRTSMPWEDLFCTALIATSTPRQLEPDEWQAITDAYAWLERNAPPAPRSRSRERHRHMSSLRSGL